jgi:hypothetical protein
MKAEQTLGEMNQNPRASRDELSREVVRGGLRCEIAYLEQVERLIRKPAVERVEIPTDEIEAMRRRVLTKSIDRIWREKGFDRDGRRLPCPVAPGAPGGPVLLPEVLAMIGRLPEQKQRDVLREQIASFLSRRSVVVSVPQLEMKFTFGDVIAEGDSASGSSSTDLRLKRGRPKTHPLTVNYEFDSELLQALNTYPGVKAAGLRAHKNDLADLAEVDPVQLWRYEDMNAYEPNRGLSENMYKHIHDRLHRPLDELAHDFLSAKLRPSA